MGFNGLIVSDATSMIGMTSFGRRKDIIPQCIASGVDMFLFTNDMFYDFQAMLQGVHDGVLTEERLNEAVTRILALKASLGLHLTPADERDLDVVGSAAHLGLAAEIAGKSVTLVKDTRGILPLTPQKQKRILLFAASDDASFFADKAATGDEFARMLSEEGFTVVREYVVTMPTMINAYNATVAIQKEIINCLVGKQPFRGESTVDAFCGLEWAKL